MLIDDFQGASFKVSEFQRFNGIAKARFQGFRLRGSICAPALLAAKKKSPAEASDWKF
jgi:hypothetical protein